MNSVESRPPTETKNSGWLRAILKKVFLRKEPSSKLIKTQVEREATPAGIAAPAVEAIPEGKNQTFSIETLTLEELKIFQLLQAELTEPSTKEKPSRKWFDERHPEKALTKDERMVLIKVYGWPRQSALGYDIVGLTQGEACADNERSLPLGSSDKHYGVWDRSLVAYSLYGSTPNIDHGTKMRVVSSGLIVGANGTVLLPGYFYTPKGDSLRNSLIDEINRNPRRDHSINLGLLYEAGLVDSTNVDLTVYRAIGSRFSWGDMAENSSVLRSLIKTAGLSQPETVESADRYLYMQKVNQLLEEHLKGIIESSNTQVIREAFNLEENVRQVHFKPGQRTVNLKAVDSGEDVFIDPIKLSLNHVISVIEDPTWRFAKEHGPLVTKLVVPPSSAEKFYYLSKDSIVP